MIVNIANRYGRIGGTMVSAIVGVNPWETPHSAYLKLRREVSPEPDNAAMACGRRYENVVAQMYQAAHPDVLVSTDERNTGQIAVVTDPEHDFLVAHPDRYLLNPDTYTLESGLEIKTANVCTIQDWGDEGTDHVPTHYLVQCQWYAGLCNVNEWRLATAFLDDDHKVRSYREYVIRPDRDLYEKLREMAIAFWENHVLPGVEPEIQSVDRTTERWIRERFPRNVRPLEQATSEEEVLIENYLSAREAAHQAERYLEQTETAIKLAIGDRDGMFSDMYGKVTWKRSKDREVVDWKSVAEEFSPSDEQVKKHTKTVAGTRRFCTKGLKYE
ncbi:MAG: YqaJ viral recombinase family protein [Planctomycetia bacterium]|nr:YqaJ viral recombinase family protein [Planctomycetia bacterium]